MKDYQIVLSVIANCGLHLNFFSCEQQAALNIPYVVNTSYFAPRSENLLAFRTEAKISEHYKN